VQGLRRIARGALAEMRNGKDRHAGTICHVAQWFEHTTNLAILVAVSLAEIRRHRINDDDSHVADFGDLAFQ
jgi:hypothetical protein